MICVCMYVSVMLRNVAVTSRWNVAVSRLRAYEFGMSRVPTHGAELAIGARSRSVEDLGRRWVELKVWRRTERGLQVEEEESVVFSNIEIRVKRAGPSGLGDLEVTEYIARIRSGPFEREDGASVHLATTEVRCLTNSSLHCFNVPFSC